MLLATLAFRMVEWFGAFWPRFPGLPSPSIGNCNEQLERAAFGEIGFCDGWLARGLLDLFSRFTEPQYTCADLL